MRRLGSKFSVFSRALAIANGRLLQTQKFAPLSFQIYEFIFCEWYNSSGHPLPPMLKSRKLRICVEIVNFN